MLEELRWKTSLTATGLYAALRQAQGIAAAPPLPGEVVARVDGLIAEIAAASLPPVPLLKQLASLAVDVDNSRELFARSMAKLHLPPTDAAEETRIAGALTDLKGALLRVRPELAEELAVRGRPLREQWEARGPGMLRGIAGFAEEAVIPLAAEVVLVSPYAGGGGVAHPGQNRVTFEAMLFHPLAALPETVRLTWLLAQLNSELPRYAEVLSPERRELVFAAAMLLPTLAAAQDVELAACDEATLALALDAWGLSAELPPSATATLWTWWTAWLDHPASWPVAIAALERLLH